ncbi:MAG TPA: hypothetical protein ENK85_01190 [Saprospiraceae bacterium]|nr:hypothetical protein [Saprospiraceae bacterium]
MRQFIPFFLLFFYASSLFAQDILVSDKISIRDDYAFYLLGKQNDQYLMLRDKGSDFIIQAFNANMSKAWDKKINLDGRRTEIVDAFGGDNAFYILYQYKKKGHVFLKIHQYDAAGELMDSVLVNNYGLRFNSPFPLVQYSPDKTKILVYHVENDLTVESIAFDVKTMKKLWTYNFEIDESIGRKYLFQPIITDDAEAFFSYEINNRKSKLANHQFIVQAKSMQSEKTIKIPVHDFLVSDYQFVYDPIHHQLIGVGLYAEKSINRANGVFMFHVHSTRVGTVYKVPFDQRLVASLAGKANRKANRGAEDLQLSDVIVRSDGGVLMMMEIVKIFHRSAIEVPGQYHRSNLARMSTDYYYEDVFALSISPSGAADWRTMLYKQQMSQNDQGIYSSYLLWQNKSSIRLIFNDEIKRRTNVIEYVLDVDGHSKRHSLLNTSDSELLLRMRDGLQVAANEVIVPSQYKKKLKLVLIRY